MLKQKFLFRTLSLLVCFSIAISAFNTKVLADNNEKESESIVDDNTYQPIDRNISQNMKNAAMGDGNVDSKNNVLSRSIGSPYWQTSNGKKNFYDASGKLMYGEGTKLVIDVSEHNEKIDWNKVKASGVDGVIIRIGWGYLGDDKEFKYNIEECNRLGIPYGLYLYSYAYDANFAYAEALGTVEMLSNVNVNLSYPIYYDIEAFDSWRDTNGELREHPNTANEYEKIITTYISKMNNDGYANVHVYSYRSYLQNQLNSSTILKYVSWIAAYTDVLGYTNQYYNGEQGWQYTSSGSINGISGNVDISCFSNQVVNPSIKSIELEASRKMSVGTNYQYKPIVKPTNSKEKIMWRTGNSAIATVNSNGIVSAKGVGKTYVYARTLNGIEVKSLITVLPVAQRVILNISRKELSVKSSFKLRATITPADASQSVTWRVGNSAVAVVDQKGNVTAKGAGSTYVYAKTWNGKEAKCLVKVANASAISVSLNNTTKTATEGVKFKLTAKVEPSTASQSVIWRVGNSAIASVDSAGNVMAKKAGSTYVYAKTANGKETKCLVKVVSPATDVNLSYTTKMMSKGTSFKFSATVTPSTALQSVTWRTGNATVATVDSSGKVTAKDVGNTYVYAKTANGKETKCLIKVIPVATGVTMPYTIKTVEVNTITKFSATVSPSNANQSVTWRTGNPAIATVDASGNVKTVAKGNTYIYAKTSNGFEIKCLLKSI